MSDAKLKSAKAWSEQRSCDMFRDDCPTLAEFVEAVRAELREFLAAKLWEASIPLHKSKSTFDGCEAAGMNRAQRIVETFGVEKP